MSEPRFLLVWGCTMNGLSLPAWPTAAGQANSAQASGAQDGCWCSWRLLGANNRELGRGAQSYPDDASCRAGLMRGQGGAMGATPEVVPQEGQWSWRCRSDGDVFAVAPRAYQRQRECHYGFQQFLLGLVSARVPSTDQNNWSTKGFTHCLASRSSACRRPLAGAASKRSAAKAPIR